MDRQSIHLRLPKGLHDELRATAEAQGISLNSLLVALLAGSVGWTLSPEQKKKARAEGESAEPMTTSRRNPDAVE